MLASRAIIDNIFSPVEGFYAETVICILFIFYYNSFLSVEKKFYYFTGGV